MHANKGKDKLKDVAATANSGRDEDRDPKPQERHPQKRFWRNWEPIVKFTFVIAISTMVYSVITVAIYFLERNNARLDQRAWIGVTQMDEPLFTDSSGKKIYIKEGQRGVFTVHVTNSGKTPGLHMQVQNTYAYLFRTPFSAKYREQTPNPKSNWVVQPQAKLSISTNDEFLFTGDHIRAIEEGDAIVYVYGTIAYDDIFKKTHHTTFCLYLNRNLTAFSGCETYNEAD